MHRCGPSSVSPSEKMTDPVQGGSASHHLPGGSRESGGIGHDRKMARSPARAGAYRTEDREYPRKLDENYSR
jgi:hypothetical protein